MRGDVKREKRKIYGRKERREKKRRDKREEEADREYMRKGIVSCGQFFGTVTQASKAKDEAASLRGELRLARSEKADRSILSLSFF